MTSLIAVSLLGALLLAFGGRLLIQFRSRRNQQLVTIQDYSNARQALDSLLFKTAAIKRILSDEDFEFIAGFGNQDARKLFLEERKRLAIQWLRSTQNQITQIVNLHLKLVSYTNDPSPRLELSLTAKYMAFLISSHLVLLAWRVLGPFKAASTISYTVRSIEDFCTRLNVRLDEVSRNRMSSAVTNL